MKKLFFAAVIVLSSGVTALSFTKKADTTDKTKIEVAKADFNNKSIHSYSQSDVLKAD